MRLPPFNLHVGREQIPFPGALLAQCIGSLSPLARRATCRLERLLTRLLRSAVPLQVRILSALLLTLHREHGLGKSEVGPSLAQGRP